jgi:hypothetical protein
MSYDNISGKEMKLPGRRLLHLAAVSATAFLVLIVHPAGAQNVMTPATTYADRTLTVNGLRLHYLDWGAPARPAMILLHGIARHAHTFDHIAPEFARDYHVIALDMRGHGDSAWSPEGAYLVEDHAKDLAGVIRSSALRV